MTIFRLPSIKREFSDNHSVLPFSYLTESTFHKYLVLYFVKCRGVTWQKSGVLHNVGPPESLIKFHQESPSALPLITSKKKRVVNLKRRQTKSKADRQRDKYTQLTLPLPVPQALPFLLLWKTCITSFPVCPSAYPISTRVSRPFPLYW